ncbi:MAG: hypothetical protein AB7T63_00455 [Planctomycetota bacterium]
MATLLHRRLPLRLHMAAIFLAVITFGVVISRLFLAAGIDARWLRWPLGVVAAYGFFLLCVRFWLDKIHPAVRPQAVEAALGAAQVAVDPASPVSEITYRAVQHGALRAPVRSTARRGAAAGGEGSFTLPDVDVGDADGIGVVIAIVVLVVSLTAAAVVFIVQAPAILGEAGAEALLAVSLRRRLRYTPPTQWLGGVVKRTILIAVAVFVIAGVAGAIVDHLEADTGAARGAPSR